MRLTTATLAGIALVITLMPASLAAEAKIYPYHGPNYCPAGFQPVQIDGVICCGRPNQHKSYSQALAHPVAKKHKPRPVYSARVQCKPGVKGCS